jgi:nicotinate-nucleotide adenylyltransferase
MKIALFGGSFDPIHEGHLKVALMVLRQTDVKEVWFVPNMRSPLKEGVHESFEHRLALIKTMIKPYRRLKVCDIESHLPQPSKTIHTVLALKKQYPMIQWSWVMGEDQFESFSQWFESERLKTLIDFIGVSRTQNKPYDWAKQWIVFNHPASATAFREHHDLRYIPHRVKVEMLKRGCYIKPLIGGIMSEKRFQHTLRVHTMGIKLARAHQLNETKISLSAYLHDVAKGMSEPLMDEWIKRSIYKEYPIPSYAKHAIVSAMLAKHRYGIKDKKVIQAIVHHTEGTSISHLSTCLFVADKIEPARPLWLVALKPQALVSLSYAKQNILKGFTND